MTAKPQISGGAGMRVGVPLARAQRLAARTETPERRSRAPMVLIGTAVAGLAVAGLLAPGETGAPLAEGAVTAVAHTALAARAGFEDLPPLAAPAVDRRARIFPCVARVEDRLRDLGGLPSSPEAAAARTDALSALVQDTLDCRAAKLRIEGSLELVSAGIADLRVGWSRDTSLLHLTVIDETDPAGTASVHAEDGLPTTFVVH